MEKSANSIADPTHSIWMEPSLTSRSSPFLLLLSLPTCSVEPDRVARCFSAPQYLLAGPLDTAAGHFSPPQRGQSKGAAAPRLGFLGATPLQTFQAHPPGIRPPARGQHPAAPFLLQGNSHPPVLPGEAQRLGWSPRQGRQRSLDEKQMPRKRLQALESLGAQWADLTPITWCLSPLPCPCLVLCFQGQILVLRTHPHAPPLNGERRQLRPVWLNPSSQKAELGSCFKRQPCCYYKNRGGKNESITINPLQKP